MTLTDTPQPDSPPAADAGAVRLLIVAEHASMRFGGEASLPLHWFRGMRKLGVECWLLVHERTRKELDEILGPDAARVHYVPDLWIHKFLWRIGSKLPGRVRDFTTGWLMHLVTQTMQRKLARRLVKEHQVTVVHEPIPVSPRLPSMMYDLGAPVVIGPMNGNMSYPPAFRDRAPWLERWFIPAGRLFADFANWLIPGKRKAALLLVANERTRQGLPRGCRGRVELVCENGVDLDLWRRPADLPPRPHGRLRLVFLGRLIALKGCDLLLDALAEVLKQRPDAELWIVGDGPERPNLEAQARKLGIADRIIFHGWVPQPECPRLMAQCDVFVLPSLHECGGAVVLEAMALGLPTIALNWGGPADYINSECGALVPPTARVGVVTALTEAFLNQRQMHREGCAASIKRAGLFAWRTKARQMTEWYRLSAVVK